MKHSLLRVAALLSPLLGAACASSSQSAPPNAPAPSASPSPSAEALPMQLPPRPTSVAISERDLMTRLYTFADDSMLGREAGTLGNYKATEYLAAEARRLGLEPAGENGTYFQTVPLKTRGVNANASLGFDGGALALGTDMAALTYTELPGAPTGSRIVGSNIPVIFGGTVGAVAITAAQARGKLVVLAPANGPTGAPIPLFWTQAPVLDPDYSALAGAAGIAVAVLDLLPANFIAPLTGSATTLQATPGATPAGTGPMALLVTRAAASRLLGTDLAAATPGSAGRTVNADVRIESSDPAYPARNVVAVLRGRDPVLRNQYVAVGAHSDHVGMDPRSVDHDSLRAFNSVYRPRGADNPNPLPPTAERTAEVRRTLDSLRALRPARMDSIFNGADDDGSGSVAVLEIAEALAGSPEKPRRSVLFVWHTAEEKGLYGAGWYAGNSTVPRDSIVTMLNIDMIGRGGAGDLEGGGPGYVQLIGSRRLSTELGSLVETINTRGNYGLRFDYQYDAAGHPSQFYCRSDHYEYAKFGIPVTFFSTGGHRDYHQLTDEPQYINYAQLHRITRFINGVLVEVANADRAPRVDQPRPDPTAQCIQ